MRLSSIVKAFVCPALAVAVCAPLSAQLTPAKIDDAVRRTLVGNTRPEANAQNDRGRVSDDYALDHILLQLQRTPAAETRLQDAIEALQDQSSPDFHRWLSAAELGRIYGPAPSDVDAVTGWLQSHGFSVNAVYPSRMTIDFSGSAGQVRDAFLTEIHNLDVNGVAHIANMTDPSIPQALASVVAGVVSLNDFRPHAMKTAKKTQPDYTFTSDKVTYQALTPPDLATIYDLNPLFSGGVTGKGQTIVVIEDTDLYSATDWTSFRTTFGLSSYTAGTLATVHPRASGNNCADPGVNSDDGEAILDAEWSSAAAPDAAIEVASCANTRTTFGGLIALENLLNAANPRKIVSISYGDCEAEDGAAGNASFNSAFEQAAAEGVSVFVAAGDEGAASCDAGANGATHGIGVSGWASTPYNVAVGGTDFGDSAAGTNSEYWSTTNSSTYGSALSYIPEIPWNDSCAGLLLAKALGYSVVYGNSGFCSSSAASADALQAVVAGSGGPSGCATGAPATAGVVSGTCHGYAKPSWQQGFAGNPGDGVRDIPDVSLFAGNGIWGHYYVYCYSDIRNGGASCKGAPGNWAGAGGTSFSSPIMAGIQALINGKTGSAWGNPAPTYYKLAAAAGAVCNSSGANTAGCIFHNVTEGDNNVNCGGSVNCYGSTTTTKTSRGHGGGTTVQNLNGALSTSDSADDPAYGAAAGWNIATGLGTVNAYNLVQNWP